MMTKVKRFGVRLRGGAGSAYPNSPVIDFKLLQYSQTPDGGIARLG